MEEYEGNEKPEEATSEKKMKDAFLLDWGKKSMLGEVCGFVGCNVPPERFCSCDLTYCVKCYPSHQKMYEDHKPETEMWG